MFGGGGSEIGIGQILGACLGGLMMLSMAWKARRMRFGKVGARLLFVMAMGFFVQAGAAIQAMGADPEETGSDATGSNTTGSNATGSNTTRR